LIDWQKWPAALLRTVASLPAAKGVTFAAWAAELVSTFLDDAPLVATARVL
jgi:hypothetical protein